MSRLSTMSSSVKHNTHLEAITVQEWRTCRRQSAQGNITILKQRIAIQSDERYERQKTVCSRRWTKKFDPWVNAWFKNFSNIHNYTLKHTTGLVYEWQLINPGSKSDWNNENMKCSFSWKENKGKKDWQPLFLLLTRNGGHLGTAAPVGLATWSNNSLD